MNNGEINGDLFLIRHLLILREQLIPFNIKLQKKNLNLDFQPSQKALNYFVMNNMKNIINFNRENNNHNNDNSSSSNNNDNYNNDGTSFSSNVGNNSTSYFYNNSFFLLAREGLPAIIENEIFIKKDLDLDLKNACQALKDSVLKKIFGNMDVFLTKIIAFVGDFSNSSLTSSNSNGNNMPNVAYANSNSTSDKLPALSNDARENLKKLDFMKVERVRDMLVNVQENVVLTAPDFMNSMKVTTSTFYIILCHSEIFNFSSYLSFHIYFVIVSFLILIIKNKKYLIYLICLLFSYLQYIYIYMYIKLYENKMIHTYTFIFTFPFIFL